jgi:hypothetical protein
VAVQKNVRDVALLDGDAPSAEVTAGTM